MRRACGVQYAPNVRFPPIAAISAACNRWGVRNYLRPFAKAVIVGTLAGALPAVCFTMPLGIALYFDDVPPVHWWSGLYVASLPFLISFPLVVAGAMLIGLPADILLRRCGLESSVAYVLTGVIAGVALTSAVLFVIAAGPWVWMCSLGGFSGAMTAWAWSRSIKESRRAK